MLIGKDGMIGKSILTRFPKKNLISFSKNEFDLEKKDNIIQILDRYKPDIFINAAAYTNVNSSENQKIKVKRINSDSLLIIAKKLKTLNSLLIHYSTDYVFDGKKKFAYTEEDFTNPLQYYGFSKKLAEQNILKINCKHIILRTSWVYSKFGNNFVNKLINQKKNFKSIEVVNDEYGTPTSSYFIADYTKEICDKYLLNQLDKSFYGIYHLSPRGITSRYKFAKFIFNHFNINIQITPINSNYLKNEIIVKRPRKVYLSKRKIINSFNFKFNFWKNDFIKHMK